MKRLLWLIALLTFNTMVWAQDALKAISVPIGLSEGAGAVLRKYEETFTVKAPGEAVETVHSVVTILNSRAQDRATLTVLYDKLSKVTNIEGVLYDAAGKVVRRLKRSDIKDLSAIDEGAFFEDYRQKVVEFTYAQYPFTVEFTYERTTRNLLFYPDWFPLSDPDLAVESASVRVTIPPGKPLRYRLMGGMSEPIVTDETAGRSYFWQLNNRKVLEREPYSTGYDRMGPGVIMAPTDLELESLSGTTHSWQDLGKFLYDLNAGRDQVPGVTRNELTQLLNGETDTRRKVEKVYAYMQKQTRYVFIKLGIGGWQTAPAASVAEKGYGDCKALSNYTGALLKAVGISSYLALIRAGENEPDVFTDFPTAHFNHMILCVPLERDTLWLECTSSLSAAGYLGTFTGNRHALLLTPQGGKLVRTTTYRPTDSRLVRHIDLKLAENGDAGAEVITEYAGLQAEAHQQMLHILTPSEQREWLYKYIGLPTYDLHSFSFAERAAPQPTVVEKLSMHIPNGAHRSGTRFFLNPNLLSALQKVPAEDEERRTAFQLPTGYVDIDTVVCQLPPNTAVETLFSPVQYTSKFGVYTASVRQVSDKLVYVRRLQTEGGIFPATAYADYVDFRQKLVKYDRLQVVIKVAGNGPTDK